jgi:UDP-N-acetylmuramyl tripeptide synthase
MTSGLKRTIITVVGCGVTGIRQKRPIMAVLRLNESDKVVLTSDNKK